MRLLVGGLGSTATYSEARGPDGARFEEWRDGRSARHQTRFAAGKAFTKDDRRLMRNARKRERAVGR